LVSGDNLSNSTPLRFVAIRAFDHANAALKGVGALNPDGSVKVSLELHPYTSFLREEDIPVVRAIDVICSQQSGESWNTTCNTRKKMDISSEDIAGKIVFVGQSNDLLRRPAIRREARLHCLDVLLRGPLPAFGVEMRWPSELCGDVDRRSQLAETIAVKWGNGRPAAASISASNARSGGVSGGKQMRCLAGMVSSIDRAAALDCSEPIGKSPGLGPECVAGRRRTLYERFPASVPNLA